MSPQTSLRILVDRGLCQGHAMCTGESTAHFRLAPNGTLELIKADVSPEEREAVEAAVKYCPNSALRIEPSS